MTISKEQRDELRRLHALWQEEPRDYGARDSFTDEARDLAIPLLDALDAAEAERDLLRSAVSGQRSAASKAER